MTLTVVPPFAVNWRQFEREPQEEHYPRWWQRIVPVRRAPFFAEGRSHSHNSSCCLKLLRNLYIAAQVTVSSEAYLSRDRYLIAGCGGYPSWVLLEILGEGWSFLGS